MTRRPLSPPKLPHRARSPHPNPSDGPRKRRPPTSPSPLTGSAIDPVGVALEGLWRSCHFHIRSLALLVTGGRDRALPVRRHRHRIDHTCVAGESAQLAPARQFPHLHRLVLRGRDRVLPVWRHRHGTDWIRVAGEGSQLVPAHRLPTPSPSGHKTLRPRAAHLASPPPR